MKRGLKTRQKPFHELLSEFAFKRLALHSIASQLSKAVARIRSACGLAAFDALRFFFKRIARG